jgi:hypothetical protein
MENSRKFIYRKFSKPQVDEQLLLQANSEMIEEIAGWDSIAEGLRNGTETETQYKVSEYIPEAKYGEWEDTRYAASCMKEELIFCVEEERLDDYLIADHEIWTKAHGSCDGFMGKETWFSCKTGLVTSIIFWESKHQR